MTALAAEEDLFPDADPLLSYDLAKNELSILLSAFDSLDNQIAVGVSLATTLMGVLLAFVAIRIGQDADVTSNWPIGLLVTTGLVFLSALTSFLFAGRTRSIQTGLPAANVRSQALNFKKEDLYWWATDHFIQANSYNRLQYQSKLRFGFGGLILLTIQVGVGIASMAVIVD